MGTRPQTHKRTVYCPIDGCNYTSRHWLRRQREKGINKISNFSLKCPKHQTELTGKK